MSLFNDKFLKKHRIVDWGYSEEDRALSFYRFDDWIKKEMHGPLSYLADHRKDKRKSIKEYFPNFQSSLVFLFSYEKTWRGLQRFYNSKESNGLKISSYVFGFEGFDYHDKIRESLRDIDTILREKYEGIQTSFSLDVQPVLERDIAHRSGLGWFGKNSMFIHPKEGSFFLIGTLFLDRKLDLKMEAEVVDHCGHCTACIDACPTNAIDGEKRQILANQCISTFTIEMFKEISPPLGLQNGGGEIFGCDICQDVCPWNKRIIRIRGEGEVYRPKDGTRAIDIFQFFLKRPLKKIIEELEGWSNRKYQRYFKGTSLSRTGRVGMLKNLKAQLGRKS